MKLKDTFPSRGLPDKSRRPIKKLPEAPTAAAVKYGNKTYKIDGNRHLAGFEKWDENWLYCVALAEGIQTVSINHQNIIKKLRKYYLAGRMPPSQEAFLEIVECELKEVNTMFTGKFNKPAIATVYKMAGLPHPDTEPKKLINDSRSILLRKLTGR